MGLMDVDKTPMRDNTPKRVEELWFEDGGLVVQAEQSLFRVYRGILAARSSVFKDMLAFTQPPDAEIIDGSTVIRLPDTAEDVTYFFRAIFDSSFFETYPSKVCFDSVLSIARLSHKYSVDYLLHRALVHLSYEFPTTLSAFDERNIASPDFQNIRSTNLQDIMLTHESISAHLAVIQLSRRVNALWLLPLAFYQLAPAHKETIHDCLQCSAFATHPAELDGDDQILLLTFSILLSRMEHDALDFLHCTDDNTQCAGGNQCSRARLRAITQARNHMTTSTGPNPLEISKVYCPDIWDGLLETCCAACFTHLEETHDEARQKIWDKLPDLCGLPPWSELEKMKAEALD
ncbi:hypothetical protein MSAN_01243200 [Mycena sanguinolenta]|uniref:BTB domain-containing protein n=1 Tax=Mycena sanguinolenta TaxID=230812 RepID=A0A8H6YDD8_9AGAR|nr:hypothetical protein MSAN_01243200 [Mycena sanguinolenta]